MRTSPFELREVHYEPVEPQILANGTFSLPGRLAWLMTTRAAWSGDFFMTRPNMMGELACTGDDLSRAMRTVTETWKLFRWDAKAKAYARVLRRRSRARVLESPKQFKVRVQRQVSVELGILWILRDLLEVRWTRADERAQPSVPFEIGEIIKGEAKMAPHSIEQFAEQLKRHPKSISRAMGRALAPGYFTRHNRPNNMSIYTLAAGDACVLASLDHKYQLDHRTLYATGVTQIERAR